MGYANPIERYDGVHGKGSFIRDAAAAGVDGLLVVDYPPEECEDFAAGLQAHGIDLIFLLAPTSTAERMAQVGRIATGYVYYVSLKGVTGAGHLDTEAVGRMIPRIREHVKLPVGVGFGIRDARSAQAVGSDGRRGGDRHPHHPADRRTSRASRWCRWCANSWPRSGKRWTRCRPRRPRMRLADNRGLPSPPAPLPRRERGATRREGLLREHFELEPP